MEDNKELEVIQYHGGGYKALVFFEGWRVALLQYAPHFDKENMRRLERHLLTDEVFVLLDGEAWLVVGEDRKTYQMEKNTIYNVKQGVWHGIYVSLDAQVLIVENADTSPENSEYREIT